MTNWTIGAIPIDTDQGRILVPGWKNDVFGIDWRPHGGDAGGAYIVTHMATGWSIFAMLDNIETVQSCVDQMGGVIDWDVVEIANLRERIAQTRKPLRDFIRNNDGFDPTPFWTPPGYHTPI